MERTLLLAVHLAAVTALVGGTLTARLARRGMIEAAAMAALRSAADIARRAAALQPAFALAVLASGAALGAVGHWRAPWFWVAVAAWIVNSALAGAVLAPAGRRLGAAAASAGEGPVPPAVDTLRRAALPARTADAMLGLDVAVLLLMIAKPQSVTTIAALAAGSVLMVAAAVTLARHPGRMAPGG